MKLNQITAGFSAVFVIAIAGCSNGVGDDPLAGTWSNTECYGVASKPSDIESCSTELTFGNDLNVELTSERISLAATAETPGCTTTRQITGQQWSAEHETDTLTVTGEGVATIERTDCVNDDDNMDEAPTSDVSIPNGKTIYVLSGDTLTVKSGLLTGTYTR